MTPWLDDGDVRLYHGDALQVLRELPSGSVHMCATSPPFWNLRDYNAPGQIGLEATPEDWTANLVAVFREVRRVLRDDGTLWIECGDMYASSPPGNVAGVGATSGLHGANDASGKYRETLKAGHATKRDTSKLPNVKAKDLIGAPWLLAFALRERGWYLRSEIIWARPNPMPESVTDRPTKSHSTVFLLSKRPRYFFDSDAIREAHRDLARPDGPSGRDGVSANDYSGINQGHHGSTFKRTHNEYNALGRNARSVWTIPTEPTPFAHFATWPQALVRRMILAGTSERGACPVCGAPWIRQTEREQFGKAPSATKYDDTMQGGPLSRSRQAYRAAGLEGPPPPRTVGWEPTCRCALVHNFGNGVHAPHPPVPCTVLDPFAGSGTTSLVARNHGRHSIGIELNESYLEIAAKRLQQLSLLSETYSAPAEDGESHRKETEQSAF